MTNDLQPGDTCPICEHGDLRLIKNKLTYFEYKGFITKITKDILHCDFCNEEFYLSKDEKEIEEILNKVREKYEKTKYI